MALITKTWTRFPRVSTTRSEYEGQEYKPAWAHARGSSMTLEKIQLKPPLLEIRDGEGVSLVVRPNIIIHRGVEVMDGWMVSYELNDPMCTTSWRGKFSDSDLRIAFSPAGEWRRGKLFCREGRWLNIPHPGTGEDCDTNITVFVTDEIGQAVATLVTRDTERALQLAK